MRCPATKLLTDVDGEVTLSCDIPVPHDDLPVHRTFELHYDAVHNLRWVEPEVKVNAWSLASVPRKEMEEAA